MRRGAVESPVQTRSVGVQDRNGSIGIGDGQAVLCFHSFHCLNDVSEEFLQSILLRKPFRPRGPEPHHRPAGRHSPVLVGSLALLSFAFPSFFALVLERHARRILAWKLGKDTQSGAGAVLFMEVNSHVPPIFSQVALTWMTLLTTMGDAFKSMATH